MDFSSLGSKADWAKAAYQILSAAAKYGKPCPSLADIGGKIGIAESTAGKLLAAMDGADMIRRIPLGGGSRVIEIVSNGTRTGPSRAGTTTGALRAKQVVAAAATGWPKLTMTADQLDAAMAKSGRFEDSPEARRDPGSPKQDMPERSMVFSPCGISRVYDHGGSGQRDVAGRP